MSQTCFMRPLLHTGLLLSFLLCYMEWGGGHSAFIGGAEYEVLNRKAGDPGSLAHPVILAGLAGQVLTLLSAFLRRPPRLLLWTAVLLPGLVVLLILLAGLLTANWKMILSTVPYLVIAFVLLRRYGRRGF